MSVKFICILKFELSEVGSEVCPCASGLGLKDLYFLFEHDAHMHSGSDTVQSALLWNVMQVSLEVNEWMEGLPFSYIRTGVSIPLLKTTHTPLNTHTQAS